MKKKFARVLTWVLTPYKPMMGITRNCSHEMNMNDVFTLVHGLFGGAGLIPAGGRRGAVTIAY